MTINDYQPLLSGRWDEDSLRPFGRVSGEKGERISQTNLMWIPPQFLACRDSGPSLSVKHNTDFFVHCLHHASHRVRMQNASHDLKILRVLRGISVFRRQTARYSLIEMWRHKFSQCWSFEVVNTTVYVGSVSWAVRHQSAALLDGPGRMYAFSMQAESLGRKQHIIDIHWESLQGVVWKWLVHDMTRHVHNLLLRTRVPWKRLGCFFTWQQSATLWRFKASHHRHDLGIPSSGCFVDGNKVLPSCSVEFTSMAVGGGAIATPHLASFSRASLRFVPSVRKGRMWS